MDTRAFFDTETPPRLDYDVEKPTVYRWSEQREIFAPSVNHLRVMRETLDDITADKV